MDKIHTLISFVLSELEGGVISAQESYPYLYVYYLLNDKTMFYFEKNLSNSFSKQIVLYMQNLPRVSVIASSLTPEDYTTFLEQFTISILPLFSDYIDINNIEISSVDVWTPGVATVDIITK